MYCDSVDITPDNVINLANLSDKYLLYRLKDQCIIYFTRNVLTCSSSPFFASSDPQNFFPGCLIPELQDRGMLMLQLFPSAAVHSRGCVEHDVLRRLLEQDFINQSEYELFDLCVEFKELELKARNRGGKVQRKDVAREMKDLLPLIRFPVMDFEDFTVVSKYGFLTDEETRQVFQYICERDHYTDDDDKFWESRGLDKVTEVPFSCVPRSNYGYAGEEGWVDAGLVDVNEDTEVAFHGFTISPYSQDECRKGCLVFRVKTPLSLLSLRLQLNELFCIKYRKEGVKVKITVTEIFGFAFGFIRDRTVLFTDTLNVCPTDTPEKRFHYHEARLEKLSLCEHCTYRLEIESGNTLYYYPADQTKEDLVSSDSSESPLMINWPLTREACEALDAVSDLVHGITFVD